LERTALEAPASSDINPHRVKYTMRRAIWCPAPLESTYIDNAAVHLYSIGERHRSRLVTTTIPFWTLN